jgi:hypothetical protein
MIQVKKKYTIYYVACKHFFYLDLAPVPKIMLSIGLDIWQFCQVTTQEKVTQGLRPGQICNPLDIHQGENIVEET